MGKSLVQVIIFFIPFYDALVNLSQKKDDNSYQSAPLLFTAKNSLRTFDIFKVRIFPFPKKSLTMLVLMVLEKIKNLMKKYK